MALTTEELQAKLDNLERAYYSGAQSVSHGDKRVTYDRAQMRTLIADLRNQLGLVTRRNYTLAKHGKG